MNLDHLAQSQMPDALVGGDAYRNALAPKPPKKGVGLLEDQVAGAFDHACQVEARLSKVAERLVGPALLAQAGEGPSRIPDGHVHLQDRLADLISALNRISSIVERLDG